MRGILPYLALRGNHSGPLFILSDGRGLTWQLFKVALDNILSALNMDKGKYTYGFRIGMATSAKQANIPDTYIQMLGSWGSDAYQHYIKTPPQELAKLSKHLTCRWLSFPQHTVVSSSQCRHSASTRHFI